MLRLVAGKAFTLLTTLDELKGYEEPINGRRPSGVRHGAFRDRVTWAESRAREAAELGYTVQPEVLIIGGGQGGIALGARLRQLGVPTIIVERNERPGDSWRKRYKSLALHDPVWYDHLPYLPFPASWPVFSPKDKIGDWLEMYAKVMELNYWASTTCKSAVREGDGWAVVVDRPAEEVTLRPRQLVLALGASGLPSVPEIPGREKFRGDQHHSSAHPGPDQYKGKKAVVIGSNNSAHDICAALWEAGADVTMVQRSSTHVVRSDSLMDLGLSDLYSERAVAAGMTTFKADTVSPRCRSGSCPRSRPRFTTPSGSATPSSTAGWSRPASTSTSARTAPACSSSTCGAGPVTTSTSAPPSLSRTATSSWPRAR